MNRKRVRTKSGETTRVVPDRRVRYPGCGTLSLEFLSIARRGVLVVPNRPLLTGSQIRCDEQAGDTTQRRGRGSAAIRSQLGLSLALSQGGIDDLLRQVLSKTERCEGIKVVSRSTVLDEVLYQRPTNGTSSLSLSETHTHTHTRGPPIVIFVTRAASARTFGLTNHSSVACFRSHTVPPHSLGP